MTTAALGTASLSPIKVTAMTIPSSITTSVQSLDGLQAAQLLPVAQPSSPAIIVDGVTTSVPDVPGFTPIVSKLINTQAQVDAVRSAAKNTAAAYGLNETFSSDNASIEQLSVQQQIARSQPTFTITQVLIPD